MTTSIGTPIFLTQSLFMDLAQVAGTAIMRMADAEVLPYEFTDVADTTQRYVDELKKQMTQVRKTEETNREIQERVFVASSDPH